MNNITNRQDRLYGSNRIISISSLDELAHIFNLNAMRSDDNFAKAAEAINKAMKSSRDAKIFAFFAIASVVCMIAKIKIQSDEIEELSSRIDILEQEGK